MLKKAWTAILALYGDRFLRTGFWLTVANLMGGVLGYVYQILIGRMLTPSNFALFSAVMALFAIFSTPLSAAFMVVSRRVTNLLVTGDPRRIQKYYWLILRNLLLLSVPVMILGIFYSDLLAAYLKTEDIYPVWAFLGLLLLTSILVVNNAFFQGSQNFLWLTFTMLGGIALKIVFSVGFIYLGFQLIGALLGILVAGFLTNTIGAIGVNKIMPGPIQVHSNNVEANQSLGNVVPVLVANIGFVAMTQLDMLIVNWFFSSEQAGSYAAASIFGKAVLYLPGGLVLALFPLVAKKHIENAASFYLIRNAVITTAVMCGSVALIYWLLGDQIISLVYGDKYIDAGSYLRWYGFAILPMAFVMVAEHYLIAKGRTLFCWLFMAILPFQFIAVWLWHDHIWMILLNIGVAGAILMLLGYAMLYMEWANIRLRPFFVK